VGSADEVIAALEAVREKIGEARKDMHAGAEKFGDAYGHLKTAFDGAGNPKALGALSQVSQAAERVGKADEHATVALEIIGEYIEVVKGNGPGGGGSGSVSSGTPVPELVPTPESPAPYHRRYFDALRVRTKDKDPTDGTLTTIGGEKIEDVTSGKGGPAAGGAGLRPPFSQMWTVLNHAEGHAAAIMRTRKLKNTTLYVNNEPCDTSPYGCERVLPRILPKGSTMTVYGPNGYVRVYEGTGEGLAT